jgi:uncharacterized protein HemY
LGTIAFQHGQFGQAQALLEKALQAFEKTGDQAGQADALLQLGGLPAASMTRHGLSSSLSGL